MFLSLLSILIFALPGQLLIGSGPSRGASAGGVPFVAAGAAKDPTWIEIRSSGPAGAFMRQPETLVLGAAQEAETSPKVWIGVRLTPVPAPLAAHLGERGVMIANVVKDSPADAAGLEQYDVVISLAGQEVNRPQDLTDAVARLTADVPVKLEVLRAAKPRTLEITPVKRPASLDWTMKYEEPQSTWLDEAVDMRGLTLKRGPGGEWIMRDLGQLKGLPDALKDLKALEELDVHVRLPDLPKFGDDYDVGHILRKLDQAFRWRSGDKGRARVEVRIQVDDEGKCTTIHRDADGRFHVTRVTPNNEESSATYEDEESFEQGDPESFELYQGRGESRSNAFRFRHRLPGGARELREEFQIDIERRLKDALEKTDRERARARARAKEALEEAVEKAGQRRSGAEAEAREERHEATRNELRARARQREETPEKSAPTLESVAVRVHDDGRVTVRVGKGADEAIYEFKDRESFKSARPDLYERVESLLD